MLESKLRPRAPRAGTVARPALVGRLRTSGTPVVAVTAPAGYGKTSVVEQWTREDERPAAWLSLDEGDNDPVVLLSYVAIALDRITPLDDRVFDALRSPAAGLRSVLIPRLGAELFAAPPLLLVLDDVHALHEPECLDALVALFDHVPPGAQIVLAGRAVSGLPVARLRAQGRLAELGTAGLALDAAEAGAVTAAAGVELPAAEADLLARSTDGWPVGVYLAAVAARERHGDGHGRPRLARAAHERLVRDYLGLELLEAATDREIRFLTRTSTLERMCGPLCDAVVDEPGSAELLEGLVRSNRFVIPLDRDGEWYRYNHLVRRMLRADLDRREPGAAAGLQRRAAAWCEANDLSEEAVGYAEACGDGEHVAALVTKLAMPVYDRGGVATVEGWLTGLDGELLERHPAVSIFGGWIHALRGRPLEAERWADVARRGTVAEPLPDGGRTIEPWLALLRGFMCPDGPAAMRRDARRAVDGLEPASPWRPMAMLVLGMTQVLAGDDDAADLTLSDAAELALSGGAACTASLALAERSLLAIRQGDSATAESLVRTAAGIVRDAGLEGYATTALVHAAAARCALRRGDPRCAAEELASAGALLPLLTYALPWLAVQIGIELARGHIGVADPAGARTVMAHVDAIRRRRPDLGVLGAQADELSTQVASLRGSAVEWASTLTGAELRLLPLLTTHLSFREIGERLFVSRNTVKTEAISVYRKLGVTSRSDAIERAAELGLVDRSAVARTPAASLSA